MSRTPKPRPLIRFVYVIGPQQGLQKIGLATDVQARLAALQTASPFDLLVHAAVAVSFREAHAVERHAHRLLARSRVRNEWFETSPAEAVAAVQTAAAPFKGRATPAPEPVDIWRPKSQWRISPAERAPVPSVGSAPLMQFGAPKPEDVSTHRAGTLPLFDFEPPAPTFAPETPIAALGGYRLDIQCCTGIRSYPLGLLASSLPQGGRTALATAIERLRCERCRRPAREAVLVEQRAAWRVATREAGRA